MGGIWKHEIYHQSINVKRIAYGSCILPVFTYGLQIMAKTQKEQLTVSQRAMGRIMLGITLIDIIRNSQIRDDTKVMNVVERTASLKYQWIGYVLRQEPDRWTQKMILWRLSGTTRSVGRFWKR